MKLGSICFVIGSLNALTDKSETAYTNYVRKGLGYNLEISKL